MSTLVDVPACLFAVLSLAASGADATRLGEIAEVAVETRDDNASGPYRMSDVIWLQAWKAAETVNGLDLPDSPRVYVTSSGHYYVPGEGAHEKLVALRHDANLARRVAFGFAKRNAGDLEIALGRRPLAEELYLAHRFGPATAASFIELVARRPAAPLATALPEVARLAPELARDRAATVGAAHQRLAAAFAAARPAGFVVAEPEPAAAPRISLIDGLGAGLKLAMRGDDPVDVRRGPPSVGRPWAADVVAIGD